MTDTIPEQLQRRRDAADRCEPLDCGHRDPLDCIDVCSTPEGDEEGNGIHSVETPGGDQPEFDPGDIAGLWADAKSLFFAADFPEYASAEWRALHPDDPRRLAAALDAAEKWRKYGDENVIDWLREASAPRPPIWQRRGRTAEYWAEDARKRREAQAWAVEMRQKYGDGTQPRNRTPETTA